MPQCKKVSFESMKVANLKAGEINSENGVNRMRPYKCYKCGKVHLTSMSKKRYQEKKDYLKKEIKYWEIKLEINK